MMDLDGAHMKNKDLFPCNLQQNISHWKKNQNVHAVGLTKQRAFTKYNIKWY